MMENEDVKKNGKQVESSMDKNLGSTMPIAVNKMHPMNESKKLFTVMCNYLSLSQFELARTVIDQLFQIHPDRVVRALRELILGKVEPDWLTSETVRSKWHLSWLAYVEYKALHKRVCDSAAPLSKPSKDSSETVDRETRWKLLRAKMKQGARINPLGFISHDVISVEACEIQLDDKIQRWKIDSKEANVGGGGGRWWLRLNLMLDGAFKCTRILQASGKSIRGCMWKETLPLKVDFADSKVNLNVTAHRHASGNAAAQVGWCVLPLSQIRAKQFYHIWIPLSAYTNDSASSNNSNDPSPIGRLRVKVRWMNLPVPGRPGATGTGRGDVPWSVKAKLSGRLLLWHAKEAKLLKEQVAKTLGDLMDRLIEHPDAVHWKHFCDDISRMGSGGSSKRRGEMLGHHLQQQSTLQYTSDREREEGLDEVIESLFLREMDRDVYQDLRRVIRSIPSVGHGLCSLLAELQLRASRIQVTCSRKHTTGKPDVLISDAGGDHIISASTPGLDMLALFYSQIIGEMLLRREFDAACDALRVLVSRVYATPRRSEVLDDVYSAFAVYIHIKDHKEVERHLFKLFDSKKHPNVNGKSRGSNPPSVEAEGLNAAQLLNAYRDRLTLKCKIYSALLTGSESTHEYHLRRFCYVENKLLATEVSNRHGRLQNLPSSASGVPKCFHSYRQAIDAANKIEISIVKSRGMQKSLPEHMLRQRVKDECLASFWCEYTRYCRVTKNHIFQFPLRTALDRIREGKWESARLVLEPFPQLRALAILLAWDHTESDFTAKRELIQHLWSFDNVSGFDAATDKQGGADEKVTQQKERARGLNVHCSEPRITRWCNKLAFYIRLVDTILASHSRLKLQSANSKKTAAANLFEALLSKSLLCAIRDYLPDHGLDPSSLLQLLHDHRYDWAAVGSECAHDLDLLRAYFAIRGVLQFVVEGKDSAGEEEKKLSVWHQTQAYIGGMSRLEVQVLTAEKIFCLVFITRADLNRSDPTSNPSAKGAGTSRDSNNAEQPQQPHSEEADQFVASIAACRKVLKFLNHILSLLQNSMNSSMKSDNFADSYIPKGSSSAQLRLAARIRALRKHTNEGLWRLSVLDKLKDKKPTFNLMVAPLEAISVRFLRLNRMDDISTLFENRTLTDGHRKMIHEAKCWDSLCDKIRKNYAQRDSKEDDGVPRPKLVTEVRKIIQKYTDDVAAASATGPSTETSGRDGTDATTNTDQGPQQALLQGFFFALDLAITFAHALDVEDYRDILKFAIRYLDSTSIATSPHKRDQRVYDFYLALTRNRLAARLPPSSGHAPKEIRARGSDGHRIIHHTGADTFVVLERYAAYMLEDAGKKVSKGKEFQLKAGMSFRVGNNSSPKTGRESSKASVSVSKDSVGDSEITGEVLSGPNALLEWIKLYGSVGGESKATGSVYHTGGTLAPRKSHISSKSALRLDYLRHYRKYFSQTSGEEKSINGMGITSTTSLNPFKDDRIFRFLASVAQGLDDLPLSSSRPSLRQISGNSQNDMKVRKKSSWSTGASGGQGIFDDSDYGPTFSSLEQHSDNHQDPQGSPNAEIEETTSSTNVITCVGALAQRILLPLLCVRQAITMEENVGRMASIGDQAIKAASFLPCFHRWVSWRVSMYLHASHLLKGKLRKMIQKGDLRGLEDEEVTSDAKVYLHILRSFLDEEKKMEKSIDTDKKTEVKPHSSVRFNEQSLSRFRSRERDSTDDEAAPTIKVPRLEKLAQNAEDDDENNEDDDKKTDWERKRPSPIKLSSPGLPVGKPADGTLSPKAFKVLGMSHKEIRASEQATLEARKEMKRKMKRDEKNRDTARNFGGVEEFDVASRPSKQFTRKPSNNNERLSLFCQALRLADCHLDPAEPEARSLVQELLKYIIPMIPREQSSAANATIPGRESFAEEESKSGGSLRSSNKAEEFRARCILRLDDAERASTLALDHLDAWDDATICSQVLFKLLAGLEQGPKSTRNENLILQVRRKYRVCLYYQQLAIAVPRESRGGLQQILRRWQDLEKLCESNLRDVIDKVIRCRQVVLADKLFNLFMADGGNKSYKIDQKTVTWLQAKLTNARAAANIASLLQDGSTTRDRIRAIRQLKALDDSRLYIVAKDLLVQLESAHAQYVVVRYLEQYFVSTAKVKRSSQIVSPNTDEKERQWFEGVQVATRMLIALPIELQHSLLKYYASPTQIFKALLERGDVENVSSLLQLPQFIHYRRKARGASDLDPLTFLLGFGEKVLTLKYEGLGKDVGFKCFQWCLRESDLRPKVREAVLRCCNTLSETLSSQIHKLLVVHLIQSLIRFFRTECMEDEKEIDSRILRRFQQYSNLAFSSSSSDRKGNQVGTVDTSMLLYRICRVKFSMEDLLNRAKAGVIRERLMKEDEVELAEQVWIQCEEKPRANFEKWKNKFQQDMKNMCKKYHEEYEKRTSSSMT